MGVSNMRKNSKHGVDEEPDGAGEAARGVTADAGAGDRAKRVRRTKPPKAKSAKSAESSEISKLTFWVQVLVYVSAGRNQQFGDFVRSIESNYGEQLNG